VPPVCAGVTLWVAALLG